MNSLDIIKGDIVEVVRGRKVAQGTTGTVIWLGEGRESMLGTWRCGRTRLGVKDATGTVHWTAASNVLVTQEAPYAPAPKAPSTVFAQGQTAPPSKTGANKYGAYSGSAYGAGLTTEEYEEACEARRY